jgi:hypothetical protein
MISATSRATSDNAGASRFRDEVRRVGGGAATVVGLTTSHPAVNVVSAGIRVVEHPRGGFVLRLEPDLMLDLLPTFQAERSYPNGPAWGGLIEYVIENDTRLAGYEMDREGRGWSATRDPIEQLRSILVEAASEPGRLRALIHTARAAGYGHGEL